MNHLLGTAADDVVAGLIPEATTAAVARTLADRSAAAGELLAARLRDLDDEFAETAEFGEHCECCEYHVDPDDGPSGEARTSLRRWLIAHRSDDPARTAEVVAWVASCLDRRGAAVDERARLLGGIATPAPSSRRLSDVIAEILEHEELAVLVWLVAGLVAVAGAGDVTWLSRPEDPQLRIGRGRPL